ncbi:AfsR/SARP family transcriptional regulator [Micromonospora tulbaghiae]|uniref:AfsR/SARP family transcriptional regulator n=1 Tax=Micromonospora tulbaghiae TaxID=479978 RepID=UPI001586D5CE|nr:AfsR/SARP family transcriptional regulator [Micromonospora tulbaghiae]MDX5456331.1 AfsR/SARP family transcriptional regulator [Micromonospora tulbaghiae]
MNGTVDIRALGHIEAYQAGAPVHIGPPKQRLILALLLNKMPQIVTMDSLIHSVWGDTPPASAPHNIHLYIHRIRRALGKDRVLTCVGLGYKLAASRSEIDIYRFTDRVTSAQNAMKAAEWTKAARVIREALAEWRGSPFAEFHDQGVFRDEAFRLSEIRLQALENQVEIDLALGDCQHLVGTLRPLVASHPYREKFHEQLARALYQLGRPLEALDVCREASKTFGEDLGIEPGFRIRELERAILGNRLDTPE